MAFRIDNSAATSAETRKTEQLLARVAELRKAREARASQSQQTAASEVREKPTTINAQNPEEVSEFLDNLPTDAEDAHQLSAAKVAALLDLV
ncbi:hypothetical protein [Oceanidesulfovibrio marinus]|uniref:Uncharacterized protein n=1 Tax=Oceanidesulfovibrio marinus TaxID=370038 RepID=A0A6P1ZK23_9BACT|nr:hypothetical protein [Oceanidesulfovibrio marinus]QJT09950.1 hypothetical protein E8L03_13860 [Oceanidesulfovibrio marinus]TVM35933.1 hypothetical protein DQK91_04575 [Oceanidesulfovibrio marinus]